MNLGGPGEHYRGISANFAHFGAIFTYFAGIIVSESAKGVFIQAGAFIQYYMVVYNSQYVNDKINS